MENEDQELRSFTQAYNKALELYDYNNQGKCIAAAHDLLKSPRLPLQHRIKTLILLGCASKDWNDAEICQFEAEKLWGHAQRNFSQVDDPDASRVLAELRAELDAFAKIHSEIFEEMFGGIGDEHDVDDEEEGDKEEDEIEEGREADMGIDGDVGTGVDTSGDAGTGVATNANAAPDVENEKIPGDMEENAPDMAAHDVTDEGGIPTSKSEEVTEDKKASSTGPPRNKVTGSLRFKAGKKGGLADRPSLAALRNRIAGGQQQHPNVQQPSA
ncbi:hypothetical protein V498_05314 [Pseudogymnoascus sp. VKM F-4517 (FW-2822)]|nr:hypothetical protein V498_05314 [Pseudogymnoascus sp. VKM F-4517 (FW-2822)]